MIPKYSSSLQAMHTLYSVAKVAVSSSSQLERMTDVRLAKYDDFIMGLFLLLREQTQEKLTQKLRSLAQTGKLRIGISDPAFRLTDISICAAQADTALSGCPADASGSVVFYSEIALADLLRASAAKKNLFCASEIRRLLWEEASGSGIYGETLFTYLKNDCSLQKTDDELPPPPPPAPADIPHAVPDRR